MPDASDLLMPKLGLTMTEGTVARWVAAAGTRFAAGDVIVIVETDKIANEVEAPSAGELVALLSPEGAVVPVGTPIARWRLDEVSARPGSSPAVPVPSSAVTSVGHAPPVSRAVQSSVDAARIVATPYARRLAREASLDLGGLAGSGPRGRIKSADVLKALEAPGATQDIVPVETSTSRTVQAAAQRAASSFVTADVDVTALRALDARLAGSRDRAFERRAYITLACLKALDVEGEPSARLGFEAGVLEGNARDTLSAIAARLGSLQPGDKGGDIAIIIAEGRARLLVPAMLDGWRLALGVGGVHTIRGNSAMHEMTLALSYDAASMDHASAARLLDRIAALLEEPFHLLAG